MFGVFKKLKLVKLRRYGESTKYGVAAANVKELLSKGCAILKVPPKGCRVCLYEDGSEVADDYFQRLPDNAELVLLAEGQCWDGLVSTISLLLGSWDHHSDLLIKCATNLLSDEQSQKRRRILSDLLQNLKDNSESESRGEDSDWFQGIDSRFKTKSDYMKFSCESRIRGYLKEAGGHTPSIQSPKVRAEYKQVVASMLEKLKADKYNGCYFDRREEECKRLCSREGWFSCQGAFDQESCPSLHSINPYGNRESRILFSTWNLDHMIEKKRTVIPALVEALQHRRSDKINWEYFYSLLFTRENLKLVHIVCHKKSVHDLACDSSKVYKKGKKR